MAVTIAGHVTGIVTVPVVTFADIKEDNPNVVEFEPMPSSVPVPETAPSVPAPSEPVPA